MKSLRFIFFLAWRNVIRYRKRTLQSFLILFFGTTCIMLVDAYMKGYAAASTERIVSQTGHLDAHAKGYLDSAEAMPLDLAIADSEGVMDEMLAQATAVTESGTHLVVSPSVWTGCMLSNGEVSRAAPVLACEAYGRAASGVTESVNPVLSDARTSIVSGRFFRDNAEGGAILDEKYAKKLSLVVGDRLILLGNDAYGSFSMMETPILAIARESSLPDGAGCVVDLASFSPVFGLEGKATCISAWFVTGKGAVIPEGNAEPAASRAILAAMKSRQDIETRAFEQISASYAAMFEFLDLFLLGMMGVFAVVAAVGMTNAILLSVQDRVKDLGTLRAIALTSRQAALLVYAETLITGVLAALCSLAVGTVTIRLLENVQYSFDFELSSIGSSLPNSIRPTLFIVRLVTISAISAIFPILAAIIPAHMARKLTIRESLGI